MSVCLRPSDVSTPLQHTHAHLSRTHALRWKRDEWAVLAQGAAAVQTGPRVMSEQQGTVGIEASLKCSGGFYFMAVGERAGGKLEA